MIFILFYLDSGLDSDYIQDEFHYDNTSPTVEDGTQQDETKNGHLGKCLFIWDSCMIYLSFFIFILLFFFCFYFSRRRYRGRRRKVS